MIIIAIEIYCRFCFFAAICSVTLNNYLRQALAVQLLSHAPPSKCGVLTEQLPESYITAKRLLAFQESFAGDMLIYE